MSVKVAVFQVGDKEDRRGQKFLLLVHLYLKPHLKLKERVSAHQFCPNSIISACTSMLESHSKTKMWHLIESGKFCLFGAACFDMHSPNERDTGVCLLYRSTGRCYFPDSCPLRGIPTPLPYVPRRSRE
ncbi:unnamed protein product [Ilex paraguariensis]|uniref:Uncharacterized protein n=1 Tax=Ilex paraguariensis TaxID=185542 RepID=A0ABC8UV17_9AQUA